MAVLKKPNGRWEVRWRSDGRHRSKTFDLHADAAKFQANLRARRQRGGAAIHLHHVTRTDMGQQVYVLRGADKVKIGVATDPVVRMTDLQTGCPVPLEIIWRIACPNARALESALHQRYAEHRSHGEWFDAEPVLTDLEGIAKLGAHLFAPENSGHKTYVDASGGDR